MHARFNFSDIEEHPLRAFLNNEFHARAPIPLASPALVSHLAFHHDGLAAKADQPDVVVAQCGQRSDGQVGHGMSVTGRRNWAEA